MKGNRLPREMKLKAGGRAQRRAFAKRSTVTVGLKRIRALVDALAKDRVRYVANFLELWSKAAKNVATGAEQIIQNRHVELAADQWSVYIAPYSMFFVVVHTQLMDRLTIDEEERFLAIAAELDEAWARFFGFARGQHPKARPFLERLEVARKTAHDAVVPLFTGEVRAALTPVWAASFATLENGFDKLVEVLRS